jgi:glycosyltransferase involved in cell wall biosynthesis
MHLVIISQKRCWQDSGGAGEIVTQGGFPRQICAISELFERTTLLVPLSAGPPPAGAEPLSSRLDVVTLDEYPPARRWRGPGDLLWLARNLPVLVRALRGADIVHMPVPTDLALLALPLVLVSRRPVFLRHCGNWLCPPTRRERLWKWLLIRLDGPRLLALATTTSAAHTDDDVERVFASSLGETDVKRLSTRPRAGPGPGPEPQLVYSGRLAPRKRVDLLIRSIPILARAHPSVVLTIIGDGAERASLEQLARELSVSDRVRFTGWVSAAEVLQEIQRAHIYCFPSLSEGFPKSVVEALACGLPVVASKIPVTEALVGEDCGVLVEEVTPSELAQAVARMLGDPAGYDAMASAARERAQTLTLERWGSAIYGLLRKRFGDRLQR